MTKIKLCGLKRMVDIEYVNILKPDYIGFVFYPKSKRYVDHDEALAMRTKLDDDIKACGVFVNEDIYKIKQLIDDDVIDIIQLHGHEDEIYIQKLRMLTSRPIIQAFKIKDHDDVLKASKSSADMILLDSGAGSGKVFDWSLLDLLDRDYILAGGLDDKNIDQVIDMIHPYGVDVSSGIETNGNKDLDKMRNFVSKVRKRQSL